MENNGSFIDVIKTKSFTLRLWVCVCVHVCRFAYLDAHLHWYMFLVYAFIGIFVCVWLRTWNKSAVIFSTNYMCSMSLYESNWILVAHSEYYLSHTKHCANQFVHNNNKSATNLLRKWNMLSNKYIQSETMIHCKLHPSLAISLFEMMYCVFYWSKLIDGSYVSLTIEIKATQISLEDFSFSS